MRQFSTIFTLCALLILCTAGGLAQRRYVVWSGEQDCGAKGGGIFGSEVISCSSVETPRGTVSMLSHDGLTLGIAIIEEGELLILGAQIRNSTPAVIQFDTDLWGVSHFRKISDPTDRVKPLAAETSIPYRDLVGGANASAAKDSAIDVYLAENSKTARTREVRRPDGNRTRSTVVLPDEDAVRMADDRVVSRRALAGEEKEKYRNSPLARKWLAPNTAVAGLVYFRRYRKAELVIFSIKLRDTTYIYRLSRDRQLRSSK